MVGSVKQMFQCVFNFVAKEYYEPVVDVTSHLSHEQQQKLEEKKLKIMR
jgi:hypothetical protein